MTSSSTSQITFYYLLDTIILIYFVETRLKMKKKISTKISEHTIARFCDVVSQTPQSVYISRWIYGQLFLKLQLCMQWLIKTSHNNWRFRSILSCKYRIRFFIRFCNVDFLPHSFWKEEFTKNPEDIQKFKWRKQKGNTNSISDVLMKAVLRTKLLFYGNLVKRRKHNLSKHHLINSNYKTTFKEYNQAFLTPLI